MILALYKLIALVTTLNICILIVYELIFDEFGHTRYLDILFPLIIFFMTIVNVATYNQSFSLSNVLIVFLMRYFTLIVIFTVWIYWLLF